MDETLLKVLLKIYEKGLTFDLEMSYIWPNRISLLGYRLIWQHNSDVGAGRLPFPCQRRQRSYSICGRSWTCQGELWVSLRVLAVLLHEGWSLPVGRMNCRTYWSSSQILGGKTVQELKCSPFPSANVVNQTIPRMTRAWGSSLSWIGEFLDTPRGWQLSLVRSGGSYWSWGEKMTYQ